MKLTPSQRKFLVAAIADDGRVQRTGTGLVFAKAPGWRAGDARLRDDTGMALRVAGLIQAVKKPGTHNTERFGTGFLYRITDLGREHVADGPMR